MSLATGCTALRVLGLSVNRLTVLPPLDGLSALQELRLDDNPLTALPGSLPPQLRTMGLSVCAGVTRLPDAIGALAQLTQLSIGAARLDRVESVAALGSLVTLQLSGNVLTALPDDLSGLVHLTTLEVSDNRISSLPATVGELPRLVTLRASENRLSWLPQSIGSLGRTLTTLCATANRLDALPDSMFELTKLEVLELACNRLRALPADVGRLASLRRLLLDDNQIESLPPSLSRLAKLEELGLAHNHLVALPPELLATAQSGLGARLRTLRLQDNQLVTPPDVSALVVLDAPPLLFANAFNAPLSAAAAAPSAATTPPPVPTVPTHVDVTDRSADAAAPSSPMPAPPPPLRRLPVALLLPGLIRNYSHGAHVQRFVSSLAHAYDVRVYMCVWNISGAPGNNFAQATDKAAAAPVDVHAIRQSYSHPTMGRWAIELVDAAAHWVAKDAEGYDGRYINQWAMVRRCWELMEADEDEQARERPDGFARALHVIRARPDLRVHALPLAPEAAGGRPYLAMQERLWGSDNFFFGDSASMRAVCLGVAPRYDEYTHALGQASSEPMLQKHLEEEGLSERVVRFARCVSVDRS